MSSRRPPTRGVGRDAGTKDRLLRAAALTFSAHGFHDATVRDVCRRAGANVAAVSYHFGSKESLYLETLRWAISLCQSEETDDLIAFARRTDLSDRERLRGTLLRFARGWLGSKPEWYVRLMLKEMSEPTIAIEAILKEYVGPRFGLLKTAIAPFLPSADERTLKLHVMSVVGQLLYHRVAAPIALRLLGERAYTQVLVERIAEHVTEFTMRALHADGGGNAA